MARCSKCEQPVARGRSLCQVHLEKGCQSQKTYRNRLRAEVLAGYGGVCACCGEAEERFLTVDHVDGRGAAERRGNAGHLSYFRRIVREGFPDLYQLLCFNCNYGRALNGGVCPHEVAVHG